MTQKTRILISIAWMGVERLFQVFSTIAISGLLLNAMGEATYSEWQYAFTIATVLTTLTWFCGSEMLTPMLFEAPRIEHRSILSNFFWIKSIFCMLVACISIIISAIDTNPISSNFILFFTLLIFVREPLMTGYSVLQRDKRIDLVSKISMAAIAIKITLVYIISKHGDFNRFSSIPWVAEGLIISFSIFLLSRIKVAAPSEILSIKTKTIIRDATAIWITLVLSIIYFKIDKIILKHWISQDDYVRYSTSSLLNENILALSTMLIQVIGPYYIYEGKTESETKRRLINSSAALGALLFAAAIVMAASNRNLSEIIFKKHDLLSYTSSLVFLLPIFGIDSLQNSYLYKKRQTGILLRKILLMFGVMIMSLSMLAIAGLNIIHAQIISLYAGALSALVFSLYSNFRK